MPTKTTLLFLLTAILVTSFAAEAFAAQTLGNVTAIAGVETGANTIAMTIRTLLKPAAIVSLLIAAIIYGINNGDMNGYAKVAFGVAAILGLGFSTVNIVNAMEKSFSSATISAPKPHPYVAALLEGPSPHSPTPEAMGGAIR